MTLLSQAFDKALLLKCKGYQPAFIDKTTSIACEKILPAAFKQWLPDVEGNEKKILHYDGLSVLYHSERKVPFVAAYNIDGGKKKTVKRTSFKTDPRISEDLQLHKDVFYKLRTDITEFEIGHMAANNEMAWGSKAQLQSYRTFHYPNSVPQAERLNSGIWKTLETYIIDESASMSGHKRIAVFTGPVLKDNDPPYIKDPGFLIPLCFYKVIVFQAGEQLYATAFIMSHYERMKIQGMFAAERGPADPDAAGFFSDFPYKKVFQVNIALVERETGLKFSWTDVKKIKIPNQVNQIKKIKAIDSSSDAQERGITLGSARGRSVGNKKMRLNIILTEQ